MDVAFEITKLIKFSP